VLTCVNWVLSCEKGCPAGGAKGWHVVIVEDETIEGEGVNIRRRNLITAVESDVVPTL